ncbi:MAG: GNAT family N-acetyltransferase [Chloroflexota bacterium]
MTITYREGTIEDSHAVFQVFVKTIMDYSGRMNVMGITGGEDPQVLKSLWERRKTMFEFLARTASHFWVAEHDGEIVAYARAMEHDGLIELTEFFVSPLQQSGGLGRQLLARAFPPTDSPYRTIIATLDERALARYLKADVYARFPLKYFYRQAEKVDFKTDLSIEPMHQKVHLEKMNRIDKQIIGHSRPIVHEWIATTRDGFVYTRDGEIVGYGYVGSSSGPFAVLEENDFPAVLAHAESLVAEKGGEFGVETPLINKTAIQYFMDRKFRIDSFTALFMSNVSFGKFENYLCFSPEFFM